MVESNNKNKYVKQYLSTVLKVASHPIRREILKILKHGESMSTSEINKILNIDRFNLYHHLKILSDKKYNLIDIDEKKSFGKKVYYKMHIEKNPAMAAFSFNKQEIKESKKLVEKILDTIVEIENFEIPNRNKISMIEINISYDYNKDK